MPEIIVAYDTQRAVGRNGQLPWGKTLFEDLRNFRLLTEHQTVIMGRSTFESIGRPLPNRQNIVLTRQPGVEWEGVLSVNSLSEALSRASATPYIIGGEAVYQAALPLVDTVHATEIQETFPDCDTYFPALSDDWEEARRDKGMATEPFSYDFVIYKRKHTT